MKRLMRPLLTESRSELPATDQTLLASIPNVQGPGWASERHAFTSLPLMVRPNSVIPIGSREDRPDYDYGDGVTLRVYALEDGAHAHTVVPSSTDGTDTRFDVKRAGRTVSAERQGACEHWRLLLVGVRSVAAVQGGKAETVLDGVRVTPGGKASRVSITL